ncbi:hypothetical protein [Kitasatospora phosalacinea]|uniref:Uncharacterized protein n=1 Tax=Kitasatospora phosalacinea TaxID=2065 RepID=A0ABW6GRC8_9ACTN
MDEPNIIPAPEFLGPMTGHPTLVARFHCPLGCGWWHEEPTDPGPARLPLRPDWTIDWEAHDLVLKARDEAFRVGVEHAIAEHYRKRHPEH